MPTDRRLSAATLSNLLAVLRNVATQDDAALRVSSYAELRDVVRDVSTKFDRAFQFVGRQGDDPGPDIDSDRHGEEPPPAVDFVNTLHTQNSEREAVQTRDKQDVDPPDDFVWPNVGSGSVAVDTQTMADINAQIAASPKRGLLYARRAQALVGGGDLEGAMKDCQTSLDLNPTCALALRLRAGLHAQRREWTKSIADLHLHQSVDYDPDVAREIQRVASRRQEHEDREASRAAQSRPPTAPTLPPGFDLQAMMSDPQIMQMAQKLLSGIKPNPPSA